MAPRDELAGAVVPEGTAPGGEFAVPVVRRRRGEAVQESKSCWRASGNWPTIQPRTVHTVPGRRHDQRPSAAITGGQRAVDTISTYAVQAASWEAAEELPFEAAQADVGWLPGPVGGGV